MLNAAGLAGRQELNLICISPPRGNDCKLEGNFMANLGGFFSKGIRQSDCNHRYEVANKILTGLPSVDDESFLSRRATEALWT
jgi:hypothetical protein